MTKERRFSLVILVTALCLMIIGVIGYINEKNAYDSIIEKCTADTQAVVIDCVKVKKPFIVGSGRTNLTYVYEYYTTVSYLLDGQEYICSTETTHVYHIGNCVDLHYDPDAPKNAYIGDAPMEAYSGCTICIIFGGLMGLIGVAFWFRKPRPRRRS